MSLRTTIVRIVAFHGFRWALVAGALIAALARPAAAQTYTPCASIDARVTVAPSYEPGLLGTYKYTLTVAWDVGRRDPGTSTSCSGSPSASASATAGSSAFLRWPARRPA